jgi:hypothetical protein
MAISSVAVTALKASPESGEAFAHPIAPFLCLPRPLCCGRGPG